MRAAIVLLADQAIHNLTRRIAVELSVSAQVEFYAALLPAHVSLKQPFRFEDLDALDRYTENLAARISPFEIHLDGFYHSAWNGYGILGLNVTETANLRGLHNLLNRELPAVVHDPSADHDGAGYHFHLTIEMGKVDGTNDPFQAYYASLPDPRLALSFEARQLGVFFYSGDAHRPGSFLEYRRLPLGGPAPRLYAA